MSAFIVSKATIDAVVSLFNISEDRQAIGVALWEMNREAVSQRYETVETVPAYTYTADTNSHIQRIKSAHCLRYQCSEGNVPETDLYKRLEFVIAEAEEDFARSSPAYSKAIWDL